MATIPLWRSFSASVSATSARGKSDTVNIVQNSDRCKNKLCGTAGHTGGKLVYQYSAANAHLPAKQQAMLETGYFIFEDDDDDKDKDDD
jgi:hypothetical protein